MYLEIPYMWSVEWDGLKNMKRKLTIDKVADYGPDVGRITRLFKMVIRENSKSFYVGINEDTMLVLTWPDNLHN